MRDRELALGARLGERTAVRRVPGKSGRSRTRCVRRPRAQFRPRSRLGRERGRRVVIGRWDDEGQRRDESRRPGAGMRRQVRVEVGELVGVGRAGVARALDAGPSAERVHGEPRVFGDRRQSRGLRIRPCLDGGVLGERRAGFDRGGVGARSSSVNTWTGSPCSTCRISRIFPGLVVATSRRVREVGEQSTGRRPHCTVPGARRRTPGRTPGPGRGRTPGPPFWRAPSYNQSKPTRRTVWKEFT